MRTGRGGPLLGATALGAGVAALLWNPGAALAQAPAQAPLQAPVQMPATAPSRAAILTTEHFALFSDRDTNLNDALVAAGVARKRGKPELFHSGEETACFGALPQSTRAAWEKAVDYYAEVVSPGGWTGRPQHLIRVQLAGFDEELKDAADRELVDIAAGFRAAATPAYERCRWVAQEEKNRRFVADLEPRLAKDEQRIAARLEALYEKRWAGLPIPVDVVETADWSGANSILRDPVGGHLLISTSYQGPAALEVVFHEASHLLMARNDPVQRALESAATKAHVRLPDDLWHVVLFFTTGEAVRRILEDEGLQGYTPMVYGIFERGGWKEDRAPLESAWRPYVAGERTLDEAAAQLVEALRNAAPASPEGAKKKDAAKESR